MFIPKHESNTVKWFKSLTVETQALIATTLALILVFSVGTIAYRYATATHRQDCASLNEEYTQLATEFEASKTHAKEVVEGLEKAPHAEGFTSFSAGKKSITSIDEAISQYRAINKPCTSNADEREFKDAIETNNRVIQQIDNAVSDLETALKSFQIKNLSNRLDRQVDGLKGVKLMVSAAIERAKHQSGYTSFGVGAQNLKQAETTLADLEAKIASYTAEATSVEALEERLKKIESETSTITNAKSLVAQIDRDLASFAKPLENEEDNKDEPEKDSDKESKKEPEKPSQNQQADKDVLIYGYNCEGDNIYEYRRSMGWDLASAKADANAKCETVKMP